MHFFLRRRRKEKKMINIISLNEYTIYFAFRIHKKYNSNIYFISYIIKYYYKYEVTIKTDIYLYI